MWGGAFNAQNYSTTEQVVGTWIDGKKLYCKVINLGNLPNATSKDVALGITNLNYVVMIQGYAIVPEGSTLYCIPLPNVNASQAIYNIGLSVNITANTIRVYTGTNRAISSGWVVIWYTKTTG